jgi:uncharacterized protein (DUF1800 family)
MRASIALVSFCIALASPGQAGLARDDDRTIVQVLNRIAFGPRPGDLERVRAIGLQRYIEQQLHPERISDSHTAARLSALDTIVMSSREIADSFERPLEERRREQFVQPHQDEAKARVPDGLHARANTPVVELSEQKVLRAVYSDRQLEEVLTDFWFNHFNVDARKGPERFMLTEYERETIRPRVLGRFRDLLGATARSPAMLFYLDNWMSVAETGPNPDIQRKPSPGAHADPRPPAVVRGPFGAMAVAPPPRIVPNGKTAPKGLNENYSRELMELHTLGVDGGYTQKDVTEVARAFTGWTIQNPRQGGGFKFEPRLHDPGEKIVLGHVIKAGGGESDGEQVLDLLAAHPSAAHFIATKLVRRFVSDTPPPVLVDRAAGRFRETGGDLREVMRTILTSPEFLSPAAYRAKVKTPFEFVVSALRATGADVNDARGLVRTLQQLGMPPYQCQPPTGYMDTADAWVSTGALVNRMNFALRLASNQLPGTRVADLEALETNRGALLNDVSDETRATIANATEASQIAALTLGSPEFQRR